MAANGNEENSHLSTLRREIDQLRSRVEKLEQAKPAESINVDLLEALFDLYNYDKTGELDGHVKKRLSESKLSQEQTIRMLRNTLKYWWGDEDEYQTAEFTISHAISTVLTEQGLEDAYEFIDWCRDKMEFIY